MVLPGVSQAAPVWAGTWSLLCGLNLVPQQVLGKPLAGASEARPDTAGDISLQAQDPGSCTCAHMSVCGDGLAESPAPGD